MATKKILKSAAELPDTNGGQPEDTAKANPRKRQRKPKQPAQPAAEPATPAEADGSHANVPPTGYGRLASDVIQRPAEWFVDSLILSRALTLVTGDPSTGKSTFGAWLCSQAQRPIILPGYEESIESALVPRLQANGVNLERCRILDDRVWWLPSDYERLLAVCAGWHADLLWIDPIDSYLHCVSENDHTGVRIGLESLARLAIRLNLAVVIARHPGKQPGNICPGSRQWLAVPREVVELRRDLGPPERRAMRLRKDPHNVGTGPREFSLEGELRQPRVLKLAASITQEDVDSMGVLDAQDRYMVEEAMEMLRDLLADGEQLASWCYNECEKVKLKERTVREARRRLGVLKRREGVGQNHRMFWGLPDSGRVAE